MPPSSPKRLADLLSTGRLLGLRQEAERRRATTDAVRARLPEDEAAHVVSATTNEAGELVVVMDSPVWAAKVRYRAAELGTERLRVRVVPLS
ncbi:MAG TPA: DciA family protein [Gammaproteobacteria bacterium]